jgi:ATP-dependent helicase HrpB
MLDQLPIDPFVPEIAAALGQLRSLVLVAEPGAGKTTRIPPALMNPSIAGDGDVLVVEPRRLAARLAARRVASELGQEVGEQVGYQVRFEDVTGPRTRLRYVTEGVLTRQLTSDPKLRRASVVVLDEFHERHLQADLALAWLRRLRQTTRPDLVLLVMSATLESEPVATFLGCEVVRVPGRLHEVALEHASRPLQGRLEEGVARAVRRMVRDGLEGHILVFLPGAAEIRRAYDACAPIAREAGLVLETLHGSQPLDAQVRALAPSARPKVILSTNVAETSITVPGVVAVIDSGLARRAGYSPWSGLATLETAPISQASALQRAGRAGRTGPGRCLRLYTGQELDGRPAHDLPEVRRTDLAELCLTLRATGMGDPRRFPFFEPPPEAALVSAEELLRRLGAIDGEGEVTTTGRAMLRLPLHPRLARVVLEARSRGETERGCRLAALLGERDIRLAARISTRSAGDPIDEVGPSDPLAQLEALEALDRLGHSPGRARAHGLDPTALKNVDRSRRQLMAALGSSERDLPSPLSAPRSGDASEEALLMAVLAGFPDRVGRRRAPRRDEVVFAEGGSGRLAPTSVVKEAELMVAVEAEAWHGQVVIRQASAIEPEWLIELFPDRIVEARRVELNREHGRVEVIETLGYGATVLDESRRIDLKSPEVSRALAEAVSELGLGNLWDLDAVETLRQRVAFAAAHLDGLTVLDDAAIVEAIGRLCHDRSSFAELRRASLLDALRGQLDPEALARLPRIAPEQVCIPGRRSVAVHYLKDRPPYIESRLQDFFGAAEGPRIADGAVPLVLHLLAPNGRAVQVTTDLSGFWERHYPSIRKQLMRRYPKHYWPEDPRTASPRKPGRHPRC